MKHLGVSVLILIIGCSLTVDARELFVTTRDVARNSAYIAHVRVEGSYSASGKLHGFQDYTLRVLYNIKGKLPEMIILRVMTRPGTSVYPDKSELVVMLGKKNSHGLYTIGSFYWSIIPLYVDTTDGTRVLVRPLTGFGAVGRYSLKDFKRMVQRIR